MKRFMLTSRLAALVATTLLVSAGAGRAEDPITIGFAGALSGPASFTGIEIKRGAEMAVDEINAKGGVKGRAS